MLLGVGRIFGEDDILPSPSFLTTHALGYFDYYLKRPFGTKSPGREDGYRGHVRIQVG